MYLNNYFIFITFLLLFNGSGSEAIGKTVTHKNPQKEPAFQVNIYNKEKAYNGTTIFFDMHDRNKPRIVELDMEGRIIWEYAVPRTLKQYTNPGPDVEVLPDNNILAVFPRKGVYEIDRKGEIVWKYKDSKVSHDADRLENGNTIMVFGANDNKRDVQVKEVDMEGKVVWQWKANDHFNKYPYKNISWQGWTHTNAVTRMQNGNTLISPRNFNIIVEVNPQGSIVRTIGEGICFSQHDPEVQVNGNILFANQNISERDLNGFPNAESIRDTQPKWHQAIELDPETGKIVWQSMKFRMEDMPVRDADRLPNGNTLITTSGRLVEVTKEGEIVWELKLMNKKNRQGEKTTHGFYKAERIPLH